jgi:[ribosomal protein S18]-alanine N-acetyltransferase
LIGFIVGRMTQTLSANETTEAEIFNIGVSPEFRRSGIGSFLLKTFVEQCRSAHVNLIWLEVRKGNVGAIRFYSSRGFQAKYERVSYYSDPIEDAIVMNATI